MSERQAWALQEFKKGAKLERGMLQDRFGVSVRTAKRDLSQLTARRLIEYFREGRGGHYRLRG